MRGVCFHGDVYLPSVASVWLWRDLCVEEMGREIGILWMDVMVALGCGN